MSQYLTGLARILSQAGPAAALVATDSGVGGGVDIGAHSWKFTWVDSAGRETLPSPASNVVTIAASAKRVDLSAIAVGPGGTVKRRVYRTVAGDTGDWKLVGEITDNATTTYQDTIADAALTAAAPAAGTFASNLVRLNGGVTTDTIAPNDLFKFQGDRVWYPVASIVDDDEFTITAAYAGDLSVYPLDTDLAYTLHRTFTANVALLEVDANDVEMLAVFTENMRRIDQLLQGHATPPGGVDRMLQATVPGNIPLLVRGAAAQTADLTQWQDSAGALLLAVTAAGALIAPGSMGFGIDSDNNQTDRKFTWRKDTTAPLTAGTELMSLSEAGNLVLPVATATHQFAGRVTLGNIASVDADVTAKTGASVNAVVYQPTPSSHFALGVVASGGAVGSGPVLGFFKTRSAAMDANTIVANSDTLASIAGYGADGASYIEAAKIKFEVDGAPGLSDMPGRIVFFTTADGGSASVEAMRLTANNRMGLGWTTPVSRLHVESTTAPYISISSGITVAVNDIIGALNFYSRDSSATSLGGVGSIRVHAQATYDTGNTPSYMTFHTHAATANDGTVLGNTTEGMRLDHLGRWTLPVVGGIHAIGGSLQTGKALAMHVSHTASSTVAAGYVMYGGTFTAVANNDNLAGFISSLTTTTIETGVLTGLKVFGLWVRPLQWVKSGTGTIATTAAVYVDTASTIGTDNYAFFNDSTMASRFDGPIHLDTDVILLRHAANELALRNGTNRQNFYIYKTFTDASNFARLRVGINASNQPGIECEEAGTGIGSNDFFFALPTGADFLVTRAGTQIIRTTSTGFGPGADATSDLGSTTGRWRDLWLSRTLAVSFSAALDTDLTAVVGTPSIAVWAPTPASNRGVAIVAGSATQAAPGLDFFKTRATSPNANTAVLSNDTLGSIRFLGADGTGFIAAAQIKCEVDGAPGTNDMPGRIMFLVTPDGTAASIEILRIDSTGLTMVSRDTGNAAAGPEFTLGRNNNATVSAAGSIEMIDRGGTSFFVWVDDTGVLRIHTAAPTTLASDTVGTVVGTQTSLRSVKTVLGTPDPAEMLSAMLATRVYDFTYRDGRYNGEQFRGLVIEDDAPGWYALQGTMLNDINVAGYTVGAIQALHARIEALETELAGLKKER